MLPERFSEAWINKAHTVLGRRLLPYCLWHRLALEVIESPFLQPQGRATIGDLFMAVRVCCSRYPLEDTASSVCTFAQPLNVFGRARLAYLGRRYDPLSEGGRFAAYIRDYLAPPEFWQANGGHPLTNGAPPEVISVAQQLITAGFSEYRAWMMPIGRAYWHAAVAARQAGVKITFVSESPEVFTGLQRLIDLHKSGKLKFAQKGVIYTP